MADNVVQNMRARVRQLRKVAAMSHNPEIIEVLQEMADEVEADADRLEGVICGSTDDAADTD
jgi:hypothetical protein